MSTSLDVIVTRPSPYGEQLCRMLEEQNFISAHCPLISFAADDSITSTQRLELFTQSQTWIFVSRQAVNFCLDGFSPSQQHTLQALSRDRTIIAVGEATADSLQQHQIESLTPPTPNSEGMIQLLEQKNLQQQPTLLVRGNKGRPLLQQYFADHQLSILQVYQRKTTSQTLPPQTKQSAIVVTSGQLMELVAEQLPSKAQRKACTIISGSARISEIAQQFGFTNCYTANNASNSELVKSCILWRNNVS